MTNSNSHLQLLRLQEQLSVLRVVYEEMLMNEREFTEVKPIKVQIRQLEKAISDLSPAEGTSLR